MLKHLIHSTLLGLLLISSMIGGVFASKNVAVDIQLGIINAYSGTLSLIGSQYFDGNSFYTASGSVALQLGATTSSTYTVQSNTMQVLTGSGVGDYSTTFTAPLLGGDIGYSFQASFIDGNNNRVQSNIVQIIKDTTPPTVVDELSVVVGTAGGNTGIMVSRDPSSDSGAGLAGYEVVFASDASLINTVSFATTGESLVIDSSLIPDGYTTIQIIAIDNVGNTSSSTPRVFIDILPSPPSLGGSSSSIRPPRTSSPTPDTISTPDDNQLDDISTQPTKPQAGDEPLTLVFVSAPTPSNTSNNTTTPDRNLVSIALTPVLSNPQAPLGNAAAALIGQGNKRITLTGIGAAPYDLVLMCTDEICVEINSSGMVCTPLACFEVSPSMIHYAAYSGDEVLRNQLIGYHLKMQRLADLMMMLLMYSVCYDIQLYNRRVFNFYKKNIKHLTFENL